jgi:carboxylate-amine ligase
VNPLKNSGFAISRSNSLGIELELQLIDSITGKLTPKAPEIIELLSHTTSLPNFKPEITKEMIEVNSGVHMDPIMLLEEMLEFRDVLMRTASSQGVHLCGGGVHPISQWNELHISRTPWCEYLDSKYGYLARSNSVFGLHIHLGVCSGDEAIRLTRNLMQYMPHLIALSASSPYKSENDTGFDSSRLHGFRCVPAVGCMPQIISSYSEYKKHISDLIDNKIIANQKEVYWDIRPKEEFGTVEIRVCDAPLTITRACQIAAFGQALGLLVGDEGNLIETPSWIYEENIFQACRHGLNAAYINPNGVRIDLRDSLYQLFDKIFAVSTSLGSYQMLKNLLFDIKANGNDAQWLRKQYLDTRNHRAVIGSSAQLFLA